MLIIASHFKASRRGGYDSILPHFCYKVNTFCIKSLKIVPLPLLKWGKNGAKTG